MVRLYYFSDIMKDQLAEFMWSGEGSGDRKHWDISRRHFLKQSLIAGLLVHLPLIEACSGEHVKTAPLSKSWFSSLKSVQEILFPPDGNGPSAAEVHAEAFVLWVLNDQRIDPGEKDFVMSGFQKLDEASSNSFNKVFSQLKKPQKEVLIEEINRPGWGENWLSLQLTYIIEAMISDPIYGFNDREQGWKWLSHQGGMPRPGEHTRYDQIFDIFSF